MTCVIWTRREDSIDEPGLMDWRAGLVVSVKPFTKELAKLDPVRSDIAYIWTIVDRDLEDVSSLLDPSFETNPNNGGAEEPVQIAIREWWINYSKLPIGIMMLAKATGKAEITYEQLRIATTSLITGEPLGEI